jgi:hypothetical protein
MSDRTHALAVQRMVIFALLLLFLAMLVGVTVATVADPSAVLLPTVLAGLAGTLGLAVLLSAFGRGDATLTDPLAAGEALRRAAVARAILLAGAAAVAGLGVALGVALGDGSVALVGAGAATAPALAAIMASTAHRQFGARGNRPTTP